MLKPENFNEKSKVQKHIGALTLKRAQIITEKNIFTKPICLSVLLLLLYFFQMDPVWPKLKQTKSVWVITQERAGRVESTSQERNPSWHWGQAHSKDSAHLPHVQVSKLLPAGPLWGGRKVGWLTLWGSTEFNLRLKFNLALLDGCSQEGALSRWNNTEKNWESSALSRLIHCLQH